METASETDEEWPDNLVRIFEGGLRKPTFHQYSDDSTRTHKLWNASKHDERNYRFQKTTVFDQNNVAKEYIGCFGSDASKEMLQVLGNSQASMIRRWVRNTRALGEDTEVMAYTYPRAL